MIKHLANILVITTVITCALGSTLRGTWGTIDYTSTNETAPTRAFESSHERSSYAQMRMLTDYGRIDLLKEWADFASPDTAYSGGKYYSFFPPGVAVSMIPFYVWFSQWNLAQVGSFAVFILYTVAAAVCVYVMCTAVYKTSGFAAVFATLTAGLASSALSYGTVPVQHGPSAFFIMSSLLAAAWYSTKRKFSDLGAWYVAAIYPISIFFDYPNAVLLFPTIAFVGMHAVRIHPSLNNIKIDVRSGIIVGVIFGIIGAFAHVLYNQAVFGDPATVAQFLPRYTSDSATIIDEKTGVSNDSTDPFGGIFTEYRLVNGIYTLLFASDKGLFFFFPVYLFMLIGIRHIFTQASSFNNTMLATIGANLLLYASFNDPWGGWAYGPRYLIPTMFVGAVLVGVAISKIRFRWLMLPIAAILYSASTAIAFIGATTTNVVPPQVEADYFNIAYGVPYAWQFVEANASGSFVYNQFLANQLTVHEWYLYIVAVSMLVGTTTLAVPIFSWISKKAYDTVNSKSSRNTAKIKTEYPFASRIERGVA